MERTRILLIDLPRMLREIISNAIEEEVDMEVILGTSTLEGIDEAPDIDVVVMGKDDEDVAERLLRGNARLRLFALLEGGKESLMYELRPQRVPLGEMSPRQLVAAIRYGSRTSSATGLALREGR